MKLKGLVVALTAAFLSISASAYAHTITFGYANAGPGSVTFWYGSYHTHGTGDGPDLEGSLTLVGVNGTVFPLTQVPFTLHTGCANFNAICGATPTGLVQGSTYFVDPNYTLNQFGFGGGFNDVFSWQGVTFTNLAAGDYQFTYIPIANPSAHWAPWSEAVRTGTVTLTDDVVNSEVPEPATMGLLGLGLLGVAVARRRRKA